MHNDQFAIRHQSAKSETQADKEWSEFERDLDTLGRQLAALQVHTASLGSASRVEPRGALPRGESPRALLQAGARGRARAGAPHRSTAGRKHLQRCAHPLHRGRASRCGSSSEPLRQGAKDVGEGLARAWTELRASFGKAAGRLQTESANGLDRTNGPVPRHEPRTATKRDVSRSPAIWISANRLAAWACSRAAVSSRAPAGSARRGRGRAPNCRDRCGRRSSGLAASASPRWRRRAADRAAPRARCREAARRSAPA